MSAESDFLAKVSELVLAVGELKGQISAKNEEIARLNKRIDELLAAAPASGKE